MSSDTDVKKRSRRRKNQGMAMVAAGALLLSGPLVAGAVAADTLTATSSGDSGSTDYVGPNAQQYGTIDVSSGTIDQVTSTESGAFGMDFIDGHPHGPVLIQQLEVKGDGDFTVLDPSPAKLPKNLNSFNPTIVDIVNADGEEPTEDEKENGPTYAKWEDTVSDGETKQYRWLGLLPEERIPFRLTPTYILDGQTYSDPNDMVGKSGEVEVRFKWNAVGQRETTVYFLDGSGNPVKQTGPLYLPSVGVFKVPLPSNFTNVRGITMDAGGDGYGGTLLAGTLVMAPPLGPAEITVGFRANVEDFYMPTGIVEWVYANVQDNASFAVIGGVLGGLGGALTGAAQGLQGAGLNEGLTTLAKITDGVSGLFDGLTDVQSVLQSVTSGIGTVTSGVSGVNKQLNTLIDNGSTPETCKLDFTLQELAKLTSGGGAPNVEDPRFCSLTSLQSGIVDSQVDAILENEVDSLIEELPDIIGGFDLPGALAGITDASVDVGDTAPPANLNEIQPCAAIEWGPPVGDPPTSTAVGKPNDKINLGIVGDKQPYASTDPKIIEQAGKAPVGALVSILTAAATTAQGATTIQTLLEAAGLDAETAGFVVEILAEADDSVAIQTAVGLAGINWVKYSPDCALAAFGKIGQGIIEDVLSQHQVETILRALVIKVGTQVTTGILGLVASVQQLTNSVISGLSTVTTGVSGINSAIGQISTTINSVIFQGLSGLLNGLNSTLATALPALGNSLGSLATTLNYEYAVFNAYAFMAVLGGAQPFGPPWKPQDITEYQVDPGTGAVVTPPTTSGAPLDGGETQPASDLNPVPGSPPPPGEADGDPTVQAIDKAGYTAYQVDLLGFGGERSVNAGIYFAAIAALLIGGIVGGLVMRSKK